VEALNKFSADLFESHRLAGNEKLPV